MRRLMASLMLCLSLFGCVQQPPVPAKKQELSGFVVRTLDSEANLKQFLTDLSNKPGCAVLGMSTTWRYVHANGGWMLHTVIAECPEELEDAGVKEQQ